MIIKHLTIALLALMIWAPLTEAAPPKIRTVYKNACRGDAESMRMMGCYFDEGIGVRKNKRVAHNWWLRAAKAGDTRALILIGKAYARGDGYSKNLQKAAEYFLLADQRGDSSAAKNIKKLPIRFAQNYWDCKINNDKDAAAALYVAKCFERGTNGNPQDSEKAAKYYNITMAIRMATGVTGESVLRGIPEEYHTDYICLSALKGNSAAAMKAAEHFDKLNQPQKAGLYYSIAADDGVFAAKEWLKNSGSGSLSASELTSRKRDELREVQSRLAWNPGRVTRDRYEFDIDEPDDDDEGYGRGGYDDDDDDDDDDDYDEY